jgi:DNA polymerase I-like protein with 3'-5' exonuclease and polymerase domains
MKAKKWLSLATEKEGRVHGKINPIGAGTHRCSHFDDNMANIARVVNGTIPLSDFIRDFGPVTNYNQWSKVSNDIVFVKSKGDSVHIVWTGLKGKYGWESRNCWTCEEGRILVGSDAAGIQLRALAHYMDDPEYTRLLIEGDIHTVNQQAAGLEANEFMSARDVAKRFIYAWLLGAGDEKIGLVVGTSESEYSELYDWIGGKKAINRIIWNLRKKGREVSMITVLRIIKGRKIKKQFLDRTPALRRLKEEDIPKAVSDGFLVGLDGRKFHIPNAHLAMSFYLQGFEAVILKQAMSLFDREMVGMQIPYKQVAFTHDEFEDEVLPEHAQIVGETRVWSIKEAGRILGSKCPLDGEFRIGNSWAKVH